VSSLKSLQFDLSIPRYALGKLLGKFVPSLYWHSQLSCLRFRKTPDLALPNEHWLKLKVTYSGICGSDMNLLFLHDSPATSPYASFPFTIGHEIVGRVTEVGSEVTHVKVGDRVVVDPVLSCSARGIVEPCKACAHGNYSLCEHKTAGDVSPGLLIGACKDTGGGWSSNLIAHKTQIFALPDEVDDLNGVLIEPFSCALHAIMRNPPKENDTVLVIGAGVIGICVIAAIRALEIPCKIVVLAKHSFQSELASHYGADQVIRLSRTADYYKETAESLQAKLLKPIFGDPVVQGGADLVIECVGRTKSVNDSLRFTRGGGKVILLGLASIMDKIDWTTVWLNELEIKGSFAYSSEEYKGKKMRTLEIAIELMRLGKVDLSPLITHRFPLEKYKDALSTATHKGREDTMKIVFEP
jgi:L-iditol 2-dehydrogenase